MPYEVQVIKFICEVVRKKEERERKRERGELFFAGS